jgi:D-serine deaminase-like pyridoxal phosphate-dependent protein
VRLDGTVKGWPALGIAASEIRDAELTVEDLPTPSLVLHAPTVEANIAAMHGWCAAHGAAISPHVKTTMAPALMRRQLAAGSWALTVADVRQARVAVEAGATRVLLANVVASRRAAEEILALRRQGIDVRCWIDDARGLELLDDVASASGGTAAVVLEVGHRGGRTGVRSHAAALELASAVASARDVELTGVSAYEGLLGLHDQRPGTSVDAFLDAVAAVVRGVAALLPDGAIVTSGGSAWFDRVADVLGPAADAAGATLVLRAGCYVTHDHGVYATAREGRQPLLRPALTLRARVLSRPERARVILDAGRRDAGDDAGFPVALGHAGTIVAMNDQHTHLEVPADSRLVPGDVVALGISHPCTTLDRWRLIAWAEEDGRVTDGIVTRF